VPSPLFFSAAVFVVVLFASFTLSALLHQIALHLHSLSTYQLRETERNRDRDEEREREREKER